MTNHKSYLLIEQKVFMSCVHIPQSVPGLRNYWWYGEEKGVTIVTKETTSKQFRFALILIERESGKISVELKNVYGQPLKQFVAEDADVQIILEIQGRHFRTDWLPLDKDLVVLKQDISHDFVWQQHMLSYKLEIKVTVAARHFNPTFQLEPPFKINKKILEEAIGSDFVIVSSSGTEIKCHKSFLCAHSDVLQAMIEGSLTEALTNRVEMVDMSDEAVKAFLAFLYYWDITEASKNCGIAFELLHAAHKYNISSLESAMTDVFLKNEISWLTVDGAVRLFAFCRNLDDGEELKMRVVQLLKTNVDTLEKSECFKELFKNDHEAAMDLFKCCVAV